MGLFTFPSWEILSLEYGDSGLENCKKCGYCCGPHPWSPGEYEKIKIYLEIEDIPERKAQSLDDQCPYFRNGGCEIYTVRPLLCRLFGRVGAMKCPNGAYPPKGYLKKMEEARIMSIYYNEFRSENIDLIGSVAHNEAGGKNV